MAGPIRGSIEHRMLTAGTTGSVQSMFVNAYNFFNNNTGSLGIKRIAWNTGSIATGMIAGNRGMNFHDSAKPAGDNAFACFCFQSASIPWYILIQWCGDGANAGDAPGDPAYFEGSIAGTAFAVSIAQRRDGGNAWNGTSGTVGGSDVKGSPVWHPRTSTLVLYPRSNDPIRTGIYGTLKENMMRSDALLSNNSCRQHMMADYDNLAILWDAGLLATYGGVVFAQYTALSGVNPAVPYVSFKTNQLPFAPGSQYGDAGGTSSDQGAVGFTNTTSASVGSGMDRYSTAAGFFQNVNAQPNKAFATAYYNEFPLLVGLCEPPNIVGPMGQVYDFFREVYNISTHDTNNAKTRVAIGGSTVTTVKLTLPWHSGTTPGSGITRGGVQFGL